MNVAQETLGLRRAGLSPALSLLMSAFALPIPPATLSSHLHRPTERSPTTPGVRSQRTEVRNSSSRPLVPTSIDALQHLGNFLILVTPTAPRFRAHVSEIVAVATPNAHLVRGPDAHLNEALEFGR